MFRTLGKSAAVKIPKSNTPRQAVILGLDVPLLLVLILLTVFGLLMVYSASWDASIVFYDSPTAIFVRQLRWAGVGLAVAVILALVDYHFYQKLATPALGVTILALVAVLVVGEVRNNAARTLLGGSVQPSEAAKLVTVLYLAVWLFSKRERLSDVTFGLLPLAVILGSLGGLIFLQPDISAVITVMILGGMMFFLAGGDLRQMVILLIVAVVVGWGVVWMHPTGAARVADYFAGLKDPTQASYHVRRALEAFVKGSWFGVGIGKAETKLTGLPFPYTDSIFAVVGEETGVVGAIGLVALYAGLLWRGMVISRRAPDEMGRLLAAGLALWISMEAFINMAVMVNLLPFAGNALPFLSAGGSNLVVTLAAMGILMNISRQSYRVLEEERRPFSAVVDLRRGNGRRRVSRPRGTGSVTRRV